jgi:hypothetical protein
MCLIHKDAGFDIVSGKVRSVKLESGKLAIYDCIADYGKRSMGKASFCR